MQDLGVEKKKQVAVERAKFDQVISQILPDKMVEDFRHGRHIDIEHHESVTIFFR